MISSFPQHASQAFDRRFRNIASRFTSLLGICYESAILVSTSHDAAIASSQDAPFRPGLYKCELAFEQSASSDVQS